MFTLWTDFDKHLSTKWLSLRVDGVTHLSTIEWLSKNVTTLDLRVEDERNVSDSRLELLHSISLAYQPQKKLSLQKWRISPFIPASDYPTVGEAIRPFEYSRWGLVYVVLINAQQGWPCFIWKGALTSCSLSTLFWQHCSGKSRSDIYTLYGLTLACCQMRTSFLKHKSRMLRDLLSEALLLSEVKLVDSNILLAIT